MESYEQSDAIERAWRDGLKPDPLLTVSEWADRYRVLSQRASSEPGRWRTERTPYLRDIMDCVSPASLMQRVALMKGAQTGGTECGNCWVAGDRSGRRGAFHFVCRDAKICPWWFEAA
jgi:phage terminase large subunit GpA-like protein